MCGQPLLSRQPVAVQTPPGRRSYSVDGLERVVDGVSSPGDAKTTAGGAVQLASPPQSRARFLSSSHARYHLPVVASWCCRCDQKFFVWLLLLQPHV